MRFFLYLTLVLLCVSSVVIAEVIKSGSLKANSDGANVVVEWVTEDEANVARFEIERRIGTDGNFVLIASLDSRGPSTYQFVDYSAFKKTTTVYQYRIKIVFVDNTSAMYVGPVTVTHTVSGVRRTWGSIKAMFR